MLENCRWLLYISRFCGCHPHTIDELSIFKNFHPLAVYSLIACGMYCAGAYYTFNTYLIKCETNVGCVLEQLYRYSRSSYMILTALLSCLRHMEFERTISTTRKFDNLIQHYHWCTDDKRKNHYMQWLIMILIFGVWFTPILLMIIFSARNKTLTKTVLFAFMIKCVTRISFSMEIAKFYFLYDALRRRFHRLNRLCHELIGMTVGINIRLFADGLAIMNLQRLHRYLHDATNCLTSYYNPQLLTWITCMLIEITTNVFGIVFSGKYIPLNNMLLFYIPYVIFVSLQIIAISRICYLTCNQANALASIIFSAETSAFKHSNFSTETTELGVFLWAHPLRIRVCGLFNLDNQFTLSVFGIILMYVVLVSSVL
ncbi:uncharacterized protein LOC112465626 [Temnothorax curvispinosus]|uniref:Gustatory receptor n=1 Tax=Temnothorax curvispinosus TaxID=300111 RepID=A0A6J1R1Z8_9HYME|nr:uncharacterized protein LOC112465626 [Temnothorax curvispinosus]